MTKNTFDVRCTGLILAGGRSSRFGSNKALATLEGTALIQRVADLLHPLFDTVLLSTNTPDSYGDLGLPAVADNYPGSGPLAGLQAAMSVIRSDWLCVVACDMPLLKRRFLQHMLSVAATCACDAVVPYPQGRPEPLCALYHKRCLPVATSMLDRGARKMHDFIDALSVMPVHDNAINAAGASAVLFHNVNRTEDLKRAEALLGQQP